MLIAMVQLGYKNEIRKYLEKIKSELSAYPLSGSGGDLKTQTNRFPLLPLGPLGPSVKRLLPVAWKQLAAAVPSRGSGPGLSWSLTETKQMGMMLFHKTGLRSNELIPSNARLTVSVTSM